MYRRFPKMPRDFYLPKDKPVTKIEFAGGEAYLYEWTFTNKVDGKEATKYGMVVFLGKQSKPITNVYFPTAEKRLDVLNSQIASCKASVAFKAEQRTVRKPSNAGVAVGDIFVSSGGYDQTNTEALQVVGVIGSATVKVRPVGMRVMAGSEGHDSNRVMPVKDSFLDVPDKDGKVSQYYADKGGLRKVVGGRIRGTWGSAGKWDGSSDYYNSWGH